MRMKRDYMGNDQLLPGYNIQLGLCDEYISVFDVKQYASDNENGSLVCPNGKEFHFLHSSPINGNNFGRTEEYYQCEDCSECPHKKTVASVKEIVLTKCLCLKTNNQVFCDCNFFKFIKNEPVTSKF